MAAPAAARHSINHDQERGQGRPARGLQAPAAGSPESYAALGYRHLSLSELVDHLLRRMSLPGHLSPFYGPIPTYYLDQFLGAGQSPLDAYPSVNLG